MARLEQGRGIAVGRKRKPDKGPQHRGEASGSQSVKSFFKQARVQQA